MSFRLMVQAIDIDVGNPIRKLVLLKLADQANDDGVCYPSIASIMKACEVKSKNTIRAHIEALVQMGLIKVERRWNAEKQCNYSNIYQLTLGQKSQADTAQKSDTIKNLPRSNNDLPRSIDDLGGGSMVALGGSNNDPEPITEPINIEPITEPVSGKRKKSQTDFPENLQPTPNQIAKCQKLGFDVDALFEHFASHHQAKGSRFVDWSRAFDTWILNQQKFAKTPPKDPLAVNKHHGQDVFIPKLTEQEYDQHGKPIFRAVW